jgi:DHA2 family multidrug resistance protein
MRTPNRYLVALTTALGLIPVVLDSTIVVVALTPIRSELGTDLNTAQWIITAFFLANAAVVPIGGYLATRFGRKRLFLLGIGIFTIGSALCAVSPGISWLIAFRVLQGVGGGLLLPIGPALAFDAFPQEERARASALIGVPILLAPVFGPIVGGYLVDTFDWHSIFLVNLPVGVIAVALAALVLPRDVPSTARRVGFDYVGLALSTLAVVAIVYAFKLVTQTDPSTVTAVNPGGNLYGWSYRPVLYLLGGGAAALAIFAVYALFVNRSPALDLRQLGRYDFLMSSLLTWVTAIISFGLIVLLPVYFESVRQPSLSALDTGLALVPFGLGTLLGTVGAAALYRALGPRWVVALGAALWALSAWMLAQTIQPTANASQLFAAAQSGSAVPATVGPDGLRWGFFILGLSFTFINIPVQTLALEALTGEALAKASSLFLSTKLLFSSVGTAIITTLLVDRTRSRATDLAGQVRALAVSSGTPLGNPSALAGQIAAQAGTWAIQSIFWLIFFGSLGIIVLALLLPGRKRKIGEAQGAMVSPGEAPAAVGAAQ